MLTRVYLGISGFGWAAYGLFCLICPEQLGNIAGLAATATSGTTEMRAMYGGVQTAIGIAALMGAFKTEHIVWSLKVQLMVYLGLFPARAIGAIVAGDASSYTLGALAMEAAFLVVTWLFLRKQKAA